MSPANIAGREDGKDDAGGTGGFACARGVVGFSCRGVVRARYPDVRGSRVEDFLVDGLLTVPGRRKTGTESTEDTESTEEMRREVATDEDRWTRKRRNAWCGFACGKFV